MKITFDLDGFIATGEHHWFFRIIDVARKVDRKLSDLAELNYYSSSPLRFDPAFFMSPNDEGFIITSRKPIAKEVTKNWLKRNGINLPIYFIDGSDKLDWTSSYLVASKKAAQLKAMLIKKLKAEVHFDNNPVLVKELRSLLPDVKIILIGGEKEVF